MGLSATINKKVLHDVQKLTHLPDHHVNIISAPPDRPNIYLEIIHRPSYDTEEELQHIVCDLRDQQDLFPKTLIFAQSIMQVYEIFEVVTLGLGEKAFYNGIVNIENRLCSMYHGQITPELQKFTLETLRKTDSKLRVLVCTIAFGMGVEIQDIRHVIHWGRSKSLLGHWQEVGRAGRDGTPSKATWYPKSIIGDDKDIFDKLKHDRDICIRKEILESFVLPDMDLQLFTDMKNRKNCESRCEDCICDSCICCSNCRRKCACQN